MNYDINQPIFKAAAIKSMQKAELDLVNTKKDAVLRRPSLSYPNTAMTTTIAAIKPTRSASRPTFSASPIFLMPTAPK
jgi:hypothetical protein